MNFLQLCRRTAVECGVASNTAIATALPTVVSATGSLGRIVNWVGDAWREIQSAREDWDFLRSSVLLGGGVTFQTVNGQATYPFGTGPGTLGVADVGRWDNETFRSYLTSATFRGEMPLDPISFDDWRDGYQMDSLRTTQSAPVVFAVGPDMSLNLGPPPNGLYTITGDYFTEPTAMALDADVPIGLPTPSHMLIVYRAMVKYGGYEAAPEVTQRGQEESARMYSQLHAGSAPRMFFGGPLA